jgi:hypothetical protein
LRKFGVEWIALHRGLFVNNTAVPETTYFALRGLLQHGWSARETSGVIWMFAPGRASTTPTLPEPYRLQAHFCQGWYGSLPSPRGRYMSETHAPFWVAGSGRIRLRFAPSSLPRTFTVDGRTQHGATLSLGKRGWHVITVDVPHLVAGPDHEVGLRLLGVTTYPSRGSRSRRTGSSP